jgi:hypothetical protein
LVLEQGDVLFIVLFIDLQMDFVEIHLFMALHALHGIYWQLILQLSLINLGS